jgi:hypothetical protein
VRRDEEEEDEEREGLGRWLRHCGARIGGRGAGDRRVAVGVLTAEAGVDWEDRSGGGGDDIAAPGAGGGARE